MDVQDIPVFDSMDLRYLNDVLSIHIPRLDRSIRDRSGDDHKFLSLKTRMFDNREVAPRDQLEI